MPVYRVSPKAQVAALKAFCDEDPMRARTFEVMAPRMTTEQWPHFSFAEGADPWPYCGNCNTAAADFLCDAPLGDGRTCDRQLCIDCADEVGADLHLCPLHTSMARDEVRIDVAAKERLERADKERRALEAQLFQTKKDLATSDAEVQILHDRNAELVRYIAAKGRPTVGKGRKR